MRKKDKAKKRSDGNKRREQLQTQRKRWRMEQGDTEETPSNVTGEKSVPQIRTETPKKRKVVGNEEKTMKKARTSDATYLARNGKTRREEQ